MFFLLMFPHMNNIRCFCSHNTSTVKFHQRNTEGYNISFQLLLVESDWRQLLLLHHMSCYAVHGETRTIPHCLRLTVLSLRGILSLSSTPHCSACREVPLSLIYPRDQPTRAVPARSSTTQTAEELLWSHLNPYLLFLRWEAGGRHISDLQKH